MGVVEDDAPADVRRWTLQDVAEWMYTDAARATAQARLKERQLPHDDAHVGDLLSEAALRLLSDHQRHPDRRVDQVSNYGSTVLRNAANDLLRGAARAERPGLFDDAPAAGAAVPDDVALAPLVGPADLMRVFVERHATAAWVLAAALATITLANHPAVDRADLPAPKAGSPAHLAVVWPGLWIAGLRTIFPSPDGDPARATRSRRMRPVASLLERALDWAVTRTEDHDV